MTSKRRTFHSALQAIAFVAAALTATSMAVAQGANGSIVGTVKDSPAPLFPM